MTDQEKATQIGELVLLHLEQKKEMLTRKTEFDQALADLRSRYQAEGGNAGARLRRTEEQLLALGISFEE